MSRKSDNFALVLTGATLGLWLLLHKIFDIFFEDWIKHQLEPRVGHTVAEMIEKFGSAGFPALAAGGIVWFLYSYIRSHLRAEAPDPMVEAQRQHTAALIAQTEALKVRPQNSESAPSGGNSAMALAGIVNALMERALQYGFKIDAVDPNDPFVQRYQDVKNSIDPVWTDDETSRLRANFLQYCAIVGSDHQDANEFRSDRAELHGFGKRLIAKLKGQSADSADRLL